MSVLVSEFVGKCSHWYLLVQKYGLMDRGVFLGIGLGLFGITGSGDIPLISYITVLGVLVWPECFLMCLLELSNLLHVVGHLLHW